MQLSVVLQIHQGKMLTTFKQFVELVLVFLPSHYVPRDTNVSQPN